MVALLPIVGDLAACATCSSSRTCACRGTCVVCCGCCRGHKIAEIFRYYRFLSRVGTVMVLANSWSSCIGISCYIIEFERLHADEVIADKLRDVGLQLRVRRLTAVVPKTVRIAAKAYRCMCPLAACFVPSQHIEISAPLRLHHSTRAQ